MRPGSCLTVIVAGLFLALLAGASAACAAAEPAPRDLDQALKLCKQGYDLMRKGDLDEAEGPLQEAAELVPNWSAPHAVIGTVYQTIWYQIERQKRQGDAEEYHEKAMAAYLEALTLSRRPVFTARQEAPWVEASQWLAPPRGILGASRDSLMRGLATAQVRANPLRPLGRLLAGSRPALLRPTEYEELEEVNTLPGTLRMNESYYAKYGKIQDAKEAYCEALVCFEVNERRLMSDRDPMVPEASLAVLARSFSLWCAQIRREQHENLVPRFQRAFPDLADQYLVGEVLSYWESRSGMYVLTKKNTEAAVYSLFKSPGHYDCLMKDENLFMGPGLVQVHHHGDFFLTIQVLRPTRRVGDAGGAKVVAPVAAKTPDKQVP